MAARIPLDVVSRSWDGNGTLTVVVDGPWPRTVRTDRAARRRARAALSHPERTRSSRIVAVSPVLHDGKVRVTVAVSRLERS